MRSEGAWFLDRRERRANDESSPVSSLGENGRGFDATAPSLDERCGLLSAKGGLMMGTKKVGAFSSPRKKATITIAWKTQK